jgi:acetyl esterase/lipase
MQPGLSFRRAICIAILQLLFCSTFAIAGTWQPPGNLEQISLWPGGAPDQAKGKGKPETAETSKKLFNGKPLIGIHDVSQPTMTVFPAKEPNSGAAIIVFPGGGYMGLAIDLEGTETCNWLNPLGITCVVVKYRVPFSGPAWDEGCNCRVIPKVFTALQDAQRAIGLVRFNAVKWKIDPKKIGVLGFSSGGHLVAATSTNYKKRIYSPVDESDGVSCRPDFGIDLYGGHMSASDTDFTKLNPGLPVTGETPPTFIVHAEDDTNDPVEYSLLYFSALRKAKVPVEMHLYAHGGHAFGLRRTNEPITHWTDLAEVWLHGIGILPKR